MATVTVNDTPIRYEDSGGDGPVILFSHGFAAERIPKWFANLEKSDLMIAGTTLLSRDDVQPRASEIACPTMAIHGSDDQAVTADRAQLFLDAVADSRGLVMAEDGAHAPNISNPDEVNEALVGFLTSL